MSRLTQQGVKTRGISVESNYLGILQQGVHGEVIHCVNREIRCIL